MSMTRKQKQLLMANKRPFYTVTAVPVRGIINQH